MASSGDHPHQLEEHLFEIALGKLLDEGNPFSDEDLAKLIEMSARIAVGVAVDATVEELGIGVLPGPIVEPESHLPDDLVAKLYVDSSRPPIDTKKPRRING